MVESAENVVVEGIVSELVANMCFASSIAVETLCASD